MIPTRRFVLPLMLSLLAAAGLAQAADYPTKPVTMVVAFAPGGPTDSLARAVAVGLSKSLGQQVIIENKAGAGGILGTKLASKANPDGYTILFAGDAALNVQPQLNKSAGYNAIKNFTSLRVIASQTNVLVANQSKGIPDVATLKARAKAQPDTVTYASAGNGSPAHLIGTLFESQAGVDMLHVPYKGAAPAMTDLIGGQVDVMFVGMPSAVQNKSRKDLVMLAVTGDKRSADLPDVPTFTELGIKELGSEVAIWWGIVAPAGLPADVAAKLEAASEAALNDPEVTSALGKLGVEVVNKDAKTMVSWIERDTAKWAKLIKEKKVVTTE